MATVNLNPAPGFYMDPFVVNGSFDDKTAQYAITTGSSAPPSISKYIAYDTLSPPNPFLAVTEDGRGRVVYDGGFPKFYNSSSYNGATTFAGLNGSCKFLYNAMHWVKNTEKYAQGNRKILILGDCFNDSAYYSVKSTGGDGFRNTLTMVANVAGFTPTFLNCSDWGGNSVGKIDIRLAQLEQYLLVVFFGCHSAGAGGGVPSITAQSVNDMVTYRENGNGLIFVTDHGRDYANINEVIADSNPATYGFFKTINNVCVRFGAYFTGDYNRVPVNVGFLRNTYGDHALYNSLDNSESIIAGGSESRVVVTSSVLNNTSASFTHQLVPGNNFINLLILRKDGTIFTARYTYIVAGDEIIFASGKNPQGQAVTNAPMVADVTGKLVDFGVRIEPGVLGTVTGEILHNSTRIGDFMTTSSGTEWITYAGNAGAKPFKNGDTLTVRVVSPLSYDKTVTINRPEFKRAIRWDAVNHSAREFASDKKLSPVVRDALKAMAAGNNSSLPISAASIVNTANKQYTEGSGLGGMTYAVRIYENVAAVNAAIAALTKNYNVALINAQDGQVYAYSAGAVRAITGLKAHHIWAAPCNLSNEGKTWSLDTDGKITRVV